MAAMLTWVVRDPSAAVKPPHEVDSEVRTTAGEGDDDAAPEVDEARESADGD